MGSITMEVLKSRDRGRRTGSTFTESLSEILEMENLDKKKLGCIDLICLVAISMKNGTKLLVILCNCTYGKV